jgi:hypothetical protein
MDSACGGLVRLPLKTCNDSAIRKNTDFVCWLRKRLMKLPELLATLPRGARRPDTVIFDSGFEFLIFLEMNSELNALH